MQFKNMFFSQENYKDKLKSVTNSRTLTFFILKFVLGLILFWMFSKIIHTYYFNYYILNELKFHFSFSDYLKLFFIFSAIDYLKVLLFQNSDDYISKIELITKIFLDPKYQTFFLFANSILILIQMKIFYSITRPGSKRKAEALDMVLIVYGIFNSLRFLLHKSNYKWNKIFINRTAFLKYCIKNFICSKLLKIILTNTLLFSVLFFISLTDLNFHKTFYSKNLRFLIVSSIFIEFINYFSFKMIINIITTPFNPNNKEIKSCEDLLGIKYEFEKNNKYQNTHYLQNLIFILKEIESDSKPSISISKQNATELKNKIETLFNELNVKIKNFVLDDGKEQIAFARYFTQIFKFSDLFYKNTSFKILDSVIQITTEVVKIFAKMHSNLADEGQFDGSPKKILINNQKYLISFFDILISFEDSIKKLSNNERFMSNCSNYKKFENSLNKLKSDLSLRINSLIRKNFKENFLIYYGESTKFRISDYIH